MDPEANIREQRELAAEIIQFIDGDEAPSFDDMTHANLVELAHKTNRLAELVQALDQWRKGGGFDPYTVKRA